MLTGVLQGVDAGGAEESIVMSAGRSPPSSGRPQTLNANLAELREFSRIAPRGTKHPSPRSRTDSLIGTDAGRALKSRERRVPIERFVRARGVEDWSPEERFDTSRQSANFAFNVDASRCTSHEDEAGPPLAALASG